MTMKKVATKVAKYLRKCYGISFVDSFKMGKKFAKNYLFDGSMKGILESLAREASYDEVFRTTFARYFKTEVSIHYDEFHQELINDYNVSVI